MPVRFEINDGMLQVLESFDFPAVYLDHWALRRFSSSASEGLHFVRALRASGGCLVMAHTNLAEVTVADDLRHADEIAEFLESVLPNIYFATFDLEEAIKQESQPRDVRIRLKAPPDKELLMTVGLQRPDDFRPFTIANIIKVIARNRGDLRDTWLASTKSLADLINQVRGDQAMVKKARNFTGHPSHLPTLAIFQELLRPVFLDQTLTIDANDVADIQHALLSIAYCDLVLLDGKWEDVHDRMRRRFAELEFAVHTAAVFSARRGGVDRFLAALEAFRSPATDPAYK